MQLIHPLTCLNIIIHAKDEIMKCLRINYKENEHVDIPLDIIADNRAKYYKKQYQRSYNELYQESLYAFNHYECLVEHWLMSKMTWEEIHSLIEQSGVELSELDWRNSLKEIQNIKI